MPGDVNLTWIRAANGLDRQQLEQRGAALLRQIYRQNLEPLLRAWGTHRADVGKGGCGFLWTCS
jgi:hypothetical protein